METLETVGRVLEPGTQGRDAIHIAVLAVLCGTRLSPGDPVLIHKEGEDWVALPGDPFTESPVGIVDPFIPTDLSSGERCWIFLNPGSITSLKHQWSHPGIPEGPKEESKLLDTKNAKGRLERLLEGTDVNVDDFLDTYKAQMYKTSEEYLIFGHDASGDIPQAVWPYVEVLIGRECKYQPKGFSCAC